MSHSPEPAGPALPPVTAELILIAGLVAGGSKKVDRIRRRLEGARAFAEVLSRSPNLMTIRPAAEHENTRVQAAMAIAWLDAGLSALDSVAPLTAFRNG